MDPHAQEVLLSEILEVLDVVLSAIALGMEQLCVLLQLQPTQPNFNTSLQEQPLQEEINNFLDAINQVKAHG